MATEQRIIREGIYNNDYFSGAQVAIYIGDVLVDEVTSMSFAVSQSKSPLYGYASRLFDGVSEGNVIVQGEFSINFKEAGYLWLILNRYRELVGGKTGSFSPFRKTPKGGGTGEAAVDKTIEMLVNGDVELTPKWLDAINEIAAKAAREDQAKVLGQQIRNLQAQASLAGYSSYERATGAMGKAENIFERFENLVWGPERDTAVVNVPGVGTLDLAANRRADEPALNPFDLYIAFGDFVDDDRIHHTIQKISQVHLTGQSKQIVIDGQPIQEAYSFFARDLI